MTRDDPILGTEKRCPRCSEWWPLDAEFWYFGMRYGRLRPHAWCRACWCEYNAGRQRSRRAVA